METTSLWLSQLSQSAALGVDVQEIDPDYHNEMSEQDALGAYSIMLISRVRVGATPALQRPPMFRLRRPPDFSKQPVTEGNYLGRVLSGL